MTMYGNNNDDGADTDNCDDDNAAAAADVTMGTHCQVIVTLKW